MCEGLGLRVQSEMSPSHVICPAMCQGAQMPPDMQIFPFVVPGLFFYFCACSLSCSI